MLGNPDVDPTSSRQIRGEAVLHRKDTWLDGAVHLGIKSWIGSEAEFVQQSDWHVLNLTVCGRTVRTGARVDGKLVYEGKDRPGALTFVPAGSRRHGWATAANLKYVVLFFHPRLGEVLGEVELVGGLEAQINAEDDVIRTVLTRIARDIELDEPPEAAYVEQAVALIARRLLRPRMERLVDRSGGRQRLCRRSLERLSDYVDANIAKDISLGELASLLEMPVYSFARAFKASMGVPPYRFVLQRRVERAEVLLRTTDMTIAAIAFAVGFSSQSHLTTTFRRVTGVTPHAYRRLKQD